ncbi:hypothetical protein [Cylindrospermopsis raciborskii]|uniref:Uncharacterized protein n=1 Tax=Cylindrospermopsis raciborskii CS-506_A TaxID=2585140 RepID=A0A838WH25_9CYAN|nr:hypothetical protein [Cylindrospermopsis raciborskii]MBA4444891.1 hypothetical protein [Cylindrospermopsis raciborskii CS-506_C]MBA4449103.1 hypothetical protein [Cylindrospermopsis raciborskii CS-506_D]MBA4465084.1 hypothetical protein [Cylindrospermopsis raciborskii CS-506_A]
MSNLFKTKPKHTRIQRQLLILMLIIFGGSAVLGFIMGMLTGIQPVT